MPSEHGQDARATSRIHPINPAMSWRGVAIWATSPAWPRTDEFGRHAGEHLADPLPECRRRNRPARFIPLRAAEDEALRRLCENRRGEKALVEKPAPAGGIELKPAAA